MRRRWLVLGLLILSVFVGPLTAEAHPHVFIKHRMTLIFGDRDVVGVRLSWSFDEMYSAMLMSDYTEAKDGTVTPADVKTLEQNNFSNLASYNFFLDLKLNGLPLKVEKVTDFTAKFVDNRALFEFTVPLATKLKEDPNILEITIFDPEYFVEFTILDDDPVTIAHGDGFAAECEVRRNEQRISALGPVATDRVECHYQVKAP